MFSWTHTDGGTLIVFNLGLQTSASLRTLYSGDLGMFSLQGGPGDWVQQGGRGMWKYSIIVMVVAVICFALKLCFEKRTGPPLHPHNSSPYPSQQSRSRSELKATEHWFVSQFWFFPEDVTAFISSKSWRELQVFIFSCLQTLEIHQTSSPHTAGLITGLLSYRKAKSNIDMQRQIFHFIFNQYLRLEMRRCDAAF